MNRQQSLLVVDSCVCCECVCVCVCVCLCMVTYQLSRRLGVGRHVQEAKRSLRHLWPRRNATTHHTAVIVHLCFPVVFVFARFLLSRADDGRHLSVCLCCQADLLCRLCLYVFLSVCPYGCTAVWLYGCVVVIARICVEFEIASIQMMPNTCCFPSTTTTTTTTTAATPMTPIAVADSSDLPWDCKSNQPRYALLRE